MISDIFSNNENKENKDTVNALFFFWVAKLQLFPRRNVKPAFYFNAFQLFCNVSMRSCYATAFR